MVEPCRRRLSGPFGPASVCSPTLARQGPAMPFEHPSSKLWPTGPEPRRHRNAGLDPVDEESFMDPVGC